MAYLLSMCNYNCGLPYYLNNVITVVTFTETNIATFHRAVSHISSAITKIEILNTARIPRIWSPVASPIVLYYYEVSVQT